MLATLLETPRTEAEWLRWSFHHRRSHAAIRDGIVAKGGPRLTEYILDPINLADFGGFLERNNRSHQDESGFLNTALFDLQDVRADDPAQLSGWIYQHYQEHLAEELAAGVSS